MAAKLVFPAPKMPKTDVLRRRTFLILKYSHDTAESLIRVYDTSYQNRGNRGRPTDEEQDLLRGMVVLAGAGLDSMTKQLIRDAFPRLVDRAPAIRDRLQKLVVRHLRGVRTDEDVASGQTLDARLIAQILMADSPREGVVEMLIKDLTANSLQSSDELHRIAEYLGVPNGKLGATPAQLKTVFDCRNDIIHELDIDFSQPNANRRPRSRADMVGNASTLLGVAASLLSAVDAQL